MWIFWSLYCQVFGEPLLLQSMGKAACNHLKYQSLHASAFHCSPYHCLACQILQTLKDFCFYLLASWYIWWSHQKATPGFPSWLTKAHHLVSPRWAHPPGPPLVLGVGIQYGYHEELPVWNGVDLHVSSCWHPNKIIHVNVECLNKLGYLILVKLGQLHGWWHAQVFQFVAY